MMREKTAAVVQRQRQRGQRLLPSRRRQRSSRRRQRQRMHCWLLLHVFYISQRAMVAAAQW